MPEVAARPSVHASHRPPPHRLGPPHKSDATRHYTAERVRVPNAPSRVDCPQSAIARRSRPGVFFGRCHVVQHAVLDDASGVLVPLHRGLPDASSSGRLHLALLYLVTVCEPSRLPELILRVGLCVRFAVHARPFEACLRRLLRRNRRPTLTGE